MMRLAKILYVIFWVMFTACLSAMAIMAVWIFTGYTRIIYKPTAIFLEICGACTAFIIWQAKGVLLNLTRGLAFVESNARYVQRGGYACLIVAAAATLRMISHLIAGKHWVLVLIEYNTLFIPIFVVAGLLCFVVANLFSCAANMKRDSDLVV